MNRFLKTTAILLLGIFLSSVAVSSALADHINTQTLSAQLVVNRAMFLASYVRAYELPNDDRADELSLSRREGNPEGIEVITVEELLGSEQYLEEWRKNIQQNDGKIFYWVHPLFMENNLEYYYAGVWFRELYRGLSAIKLGLNEDQISRSLVMAEYRHFLSHITDYVKKYPGPVFVAVGISYLEQVKAFLSEHKIKAVLIPTGDTNPTPLGLMDLDLFDLEGYGYEEWRYLHMILQDKLGVREVDISGEMCQEQAEHSKNGCVLGTKIGLSNALKFNRSGKPFKLKINHAYVFPDSLYYNETKIGSMGLEAFKAISLVESAI